MTLILRTTNVTAWPCISAQVDVLFLCILRPNIRQMTLIQIVRYLQCCDTGKQSKKKMVRVCDSCEGRDGNSQRHSFSTNSSHSRQERTAAANHVLQSQTHPSLLLSSWLERFFEFHTPTEQKKVPGLSLWDSKRPSQKVGTCLLKQIMQFEGRWVLYKLQGLMIVMLMVRSSNAFPQSQQRIILYLPQIQRPLFETCLYF